MTTVPSRGEMVAWKNRVGNRILVRFCAVSSELCDRSRCTGRCRCQVIVTSPLLPSSPVEILRTCQDNRPEIALTAGPGRTSPDTVCGHERYSLGGGQMIQPEMSPQPMRRSPRLGTSLSGDDIELPPLPSSATRQAVPSTETPEAEPQVTIGSGGRGRSLLAAGVAAGILALAGWFTLRPDATEIAHPGWQHVMAATEASTTPGGTALLQIDRSGNASIAPALMFTRADADEVTTQTAQQLLKTGNSAAAIAAVEAATRFPGMIAPPKLQLKPDRLVPVRDGRAEFFHVNIFDCCDEDGDIVQIFLNGDDYAEVPLTHDGAIVSIPLVPGRTTMTLRGICDGGGGITVMFRTSQGDFFCRSMDVGEEYQLEMIVP